MNAQNTPEDRHSEFVQNADREYPDSSVISEKINQSRRRFLGAAAATIAAVQLGAFSSAAAQSGNINPANMLSIKPGTNTSFGPLKQINAGLLNVGYAEAGPSNGPVI